MHSTIEKNFSPEKPTPRISRRRLWLFRCCAAILIPLAIFGGLELGLRLFGYGYPTSFFLRCEINGQDYYVPNDEFGYRFFPRALARTPAPQRMAVKKSPDTYRIFMFGESAAMGDPDSSFGAWRYLQVLLRERFPGTKFEVICVAMTAIDSDVILPIARECARRDGDLWVVYTGNNEMVGPFGGSTVFGSRAPGVGLIRADLALKTTRIGQLLDSGMQRWEWRSSALKTWQGLEMFKGRQLRYDDPDRLRAYENFKENLEDILRAGHKAGVPVILSTVGCNLKDCAPFASLHAATLGGIQKADWNEIYQEGNTLESAGKFPEALEKYAQADARDPRYAELHFRIGRCQLALTNDSQARREFELARDDDALAFRADNRINRIIKDAASAHAGQGVYVLDAAEWFARNSPGKIPGNELFYEHVHLNFEGNYLLGRALAEQTAKLLPKSMVAHDRGQWASGEFCDRRLAVSSWDRLRVWQEILSRISGPPYTAQSTHAASVKLCNEKINGLKSRADSEPPGQTRQLYEPALAAAPADGFLQFNFARYMGATGDLAQAAEEAKRVCELLPQVPGEFSDVGNLLMLQAKIDEAAEYFSRALAIRSHFAPALNGLGQILENRQKTNEALACFRRALRAEPDDVETCINIGFLEQNRGNLKQAAVYYQRAANLQPQGPADYFNQAVAAAALGQVARAIESFGMAVALKPEFWQAHYLLGLELAAEGKIGAAGEQFWDAIIYRPDFAKSHLNLGIMLMKQQRLDAAFTQFQITLQLDPSNPLARQCLGEIRASKHRDLPASP
ncbi:MAG TPA: tetratricopeptide repeat protein [Candidatus Limnocylindrales bacterium]|nr:tetratricopeptide repeat protein [Candidatus Limnocylindrales bacterium]